MTNCYFMTETLQMPVNLLNTFMEKFECECVCECLVNGVQLELY